MAGDVPKQDGEMPVTHTNRVAGSDHVLVSPSELGLETALVGADIAIAKGARAAAAAVVKSPDSAGAWGELGMLLSAHDMNEIAAACFSRAAELDPTDTRWPYLRGHALAEIDVEAAIEALRSAVAVNKDQVAGPRLKLAELLLEQGLVDEAYSQIQTTLTHHETSNHAKLLRARAEFLQGNWQACLDAVDSFSGEPNRRALLLAAESSLRLGDKKEADRLRAKADKTENYGWRDRYIDEVLAHRTGLKVSLNRADELFAAKDYAGSTKLLEQLVQDYPESDWAKILLGRVLIRARRYAEAETELRAALALAPASVEAMFRLGVAYYRQSRFEEATKLFRKAVQIKPDFTMAYFNLSFCQEHDEDISGAVRSMRRCVQCEPEYAAGWHRLALLEEKAGKIERARKAYQRALSLDPENQTIREQLRLLDADMTFDPSDLDP